MSKMNNLKEVSRLRRAKRTRMRIKTQGIKSGIDRLCVHRTPRHIYAQIIAADGARVLAYASSVESAIKEAGAVAGNVDAAKVVGRFVAERAKQKGIEAVAFDRSGYKYHGRIKALADAAREFGLVF